MKTIKICMLHKGAKICEPAYESDCGYDVCATQNILLEANQRFKMPLGLSLEMPKGYYARIETKSGRFANEGLAVHAGIIDNGYRGEIHAQLLNTHGCEDIEIKKGEKIAQIIFHKYYSPKITFVKKLTDTSRGKKGFGSSGK